MLKIGKLSAPRFRAAWAIHFRYTMMRLGGISQDEIIAGGNFLNYGITCDTAERVFTTLSEDASVWTPLSALAADYGKLSDGVNALRKDASPLVGASRREDDQGNTTGPTRHRFSKIPSPRRISSRKLGSRAAAKRFLAMLSLDGWAFNSDRLRRRSSARFSAALRFCTRLPSSAKFTSSCQCKLFSIPQ